MVQEHSAVGKMFSIHAAVLAGGVRLDIVGQVRKNWHTLEKQPKQQTGNKQRSAHKISSPLQDIW
jgi:hypothetical protein